MNDKDRKNFILVVRMNAVNSVLYAVKKLRSVLNVLNISNKFFLKKNDKNSLIFTRPKVFPPLIKNFHNSLRNSSSH